MEFKRGEVVEWIIEERIQLVVNRKNTPPSAIRKTPRASSNTSTNSGGGPGKASSRKGSIKGGEDSR